jgi:hypothetical protein
MTNPTTTTIESLPDCAPWLQDLVAWRLAAERPLERLVALGIVARHGGRTVRDPGALLAKLLCGGAGPAEQAKRAAKELLVGETREHIISAALHEAYLLGEALDDLHALPASAELVLHAQHWRERLAGAAELLQGIPEHDALAALLCGIDEQAVGESERFALAGRCPGADDLLASVACIDPDAWWGIAP